MDPTFPFVDCGTHGPRLHGYAVCVHIVEQGAVIAHLEDPSDLRLGEALCARCHEGPPPHLDILMLICERCVDAMIAAQAPSPEGV